MAHQMMDRSIDPPKAPCSCLPHLSPVARGVYKGMKGGREPSIHQPITRTPRHRHLITGSTKPAKPQRWPRARHSSFRRDDTSDQATSRSRNAHTHPRPQASSTAKRRPAPFPLSTPRSAQRNALPTGEGARRARQHKEGGRRDWRVVCGPPPLLSLVVFCNAQRLSPSPPRPRPRPLNTANSNPQSIGSTRCAGVHTSIGLKGSLPHKQRVARRN